MSTSIFFFGGGGGYVKTPQGWVCKNLYQLAIVGWYQYQHTVTSC